MTEPITIKFNTPFDAAVKAAEARNVVLPDDYYNKLPKAMRSRAFTVSYISKVEQVSQILTSLQKAMVTGASFDSWKKDIDILSFGISKAHAETVFRNAIQTHYAVGHWESFQRTKKALPYLRYSAINDSRTSECCRNLSGIIRSVDDPFWATHTPPNHHRCRSTLQALTESQAQRRSPAGQGLNQVETDLMNPQTGWSYNPATSHDTMLKDLVEEKIKSMPNGATKDSAIKSSIKSESYIPQKTKKLVEKFLVENDIVDRADFGKIKDISIINEWAESLFNSIKEFPRLRVNQQFTGSIQAHNKDLYNIRINEYIEKSFAANGGSVAREDLIYFAKKYIKLDRVNPSWTAISRRSYCSERSGK